MPEPKGESHLEQTEPATPGLPLEEPASARSWEGRWLREPKAESKTLGLGFRVFDSKRAWV